MNHNLLATVIGAAFLTTGFVIMTSPIEGNQAAAAYPMDQRGDHGYGYSHGNMKPGGYAAGTIASIQNDESGNPAWVLSGYWKASLTEGEAGNQSSSASNSTSVMEDMSNKVGKFGATFDMAMTNGSALHQHQIDNFTLTGMSTPDNTTVIYNGTVTITMKEGPVRDVPVGATVMEGNVISLWLDPSKLDNHFGNTPIYGTVTKAVQIMK
ncbi:MAG: hypothetical protein ACRD8Z_08840 [Nitrososphaeraceae archaeon]